MSEQRCFLSPHTSSRLCISFSVSVNSVLNWVRHEVIHRNSQLSMVFLLSNGVKEVTAIYFLQYFPAFPFSSYLDNGKFYAVMPLCKKPWKGKCLIRRGDLLLLSLWLRYKRIPSLRKWNWLRGNNRKIHSGPPFLPSIVASSLKGSFLTFNFINVSLGKEWQWLLVTKITKKV